MSLFFRKSKPDGVPIRLTLGMHVPVGTTSPVHSLVLSLTALAGVIGSVFTFITSCESRGTITLGHTPVMLCIIISWVIFSLLFALHERYPKLSSAGASAGIIILLAFAAVNYKMLTAGFTNLANEFLGMVYKKYAAEPPFSPPEIWKDMSKVTAEESMTFFLCVVAVFITLLCSRMTKRPNLFLFSCASVPPVIICLYFALVPKYVFFIMAIASWCAAIAAEAVAVHQFRVTDSRSIFNRSAAQCCLAAGIVMLMSFSGAALYSDLSGFERSEKTEQFRKNASEYIRTFTWEKFIADIENRFFTVAQSEMTHDGKLGASETVEFTGESMLEVTLPITSDTVYLKGFTGVSYNGSRWNRGASEPVLETKLTSNEFFSSRILRSSERYSDLELLNIIVRNTGTSNNTKYVPVNAAGLLETDGVRRRYGVYLPDGDWRGYILDGYATANSTLSGDELKMRSYAYEYCLDVPSGFTAAEDFFEDYEGMTLADELLYIRMHMAELCEYTLEAGKKPFGVDFAQWFLTDSRKGSCTHFATAAVMLCRSRGIPARYCEGFIIKDTDIAEGVDDGSGYVTVTVPDNRAHAWAEIYIDGYGWLNYEFTPGYGNVVITEASDSKTVTSEITQVMTSEPTYTENMLTTASEKAAETSAFTETVVTEELTAEIITDGETVTGAEGENEIERLPVETVVPDAQGSGNPSSEGNTTNIDVSVEDDERGEQSTLVTTAEENTPDTDIVKPPFKLPASVKAVLTVIAAVTVIAGIYMGIRYIVRRYRNQLMETRPHKAVITIYHMLMRQVKDTDIYNTNADALAKAIATNIDADFTKVDIIVGLALRSRFGTGITTQDGYDCAAAYNDIIEQLIGDERLSPLIVKLFMLKY